MKKIIKLLFVFTFIFSSFTCLSKSKGAELPIINLSIKFDDMTFANGDNSLTIDNTTLYYNYNYSTNTYTLTDFYMYMYDDNNDFELDDEISYPLSLNTRPTSKYFRLAIFNNGNSSNDSYNIFIQVFNEGYQIVDTLVIYRNLSIPLIRSFFGVGISIFSDYYYFLQDDIISSDFNDGYNLGYDEGYTDGEYFGNINGFNSGYDEGYNLGYDEGFNIGSSTNYTFSNLLQSVLSSFGVFLSFELLPNITLGALISVPLVFGIIFFIIGHKKGD